MERLGPRDHTSRNGVRRSFTLCYYRDRQKCVTLLPKTKKCYLGTSIHYHAVVTYAQFDKSDKRGDERFGTYNTVAAAVQRSGWPVLESLRPVLRNMPSSTSTNAARVELRLRIGSAQSYRALVECLAIRHGDCGLAADDLALRVTNAVGQLHLALKLLR